MANGLVLDNFSSTNGAQPAPWTFATKAQDSSTGLIIAPPAVDAVVARSIKRAITLFEADSTPVVQVHSISCVALHAHPIVATVSNGLSREAAAIRKFAGT